MAERAQTMNRTGTATSPGLGGLLDNWRHILAQGNLPAGRAIDAVSRWLLITRACVFSMTAHVGADRRPARRGDAPRAPTGATSRWRCSDSSLAHATNNMINDYFDTIGGVDTAEYTRTLYAPHPLLSGLISKRGPDRRRIAACNLVDLAILHRRWCRRAAGRSRRSRSPASSSASSTSRRRSS